MRCTSLVNKMASPLKPWERVGTAHRNLQNAGRINEVAPNSFPGTVIPSSSGQVPQVVDITTTRTSGVPPVPPRPLSQPESFGTTSFGSYGYRTNGTPFNSYSGYGSTFGGYGPIGRFGGNYSAFNSDPYAASDYGFIQLAEESSRPAFQSIEAIVHAVGSVNMMLESTYFAMYSSFRAVIGVAHHFSQMKNQFAQIFSALAIVRGLRWLYVRAVRLLGLAALDPSVDRIWENVSRDIKASGLSESDIKQSRSNWPFVMFLIIVFGTPWLIWRVLMSVTSITKSSSQQWPSGNAEHYVAVAHYDFTAESEREISFCSGQKMRLAPKEMQPRVRGWLLASVDGKKSGLVPANYIQILGKHSKLDQREDTSSVKDSFMEDAFSGEK